ncbi:MAG: hypothetical protein ACXWWC_15905, partial [Chitinophagaceae bacterium]
NSCEKCLHKEGRVFFYTLNGCVNSRPIKLYINNKEYRVDLANFSVPECGGPGVLTISLPAGNYPFSTSCDLAGGNTIDGIITVNENTCTKVEL